MLLAGGGMYEYVSIFLISLLGVISSYTDIKWGRIPNWLVFPMLPAALLLAWFSSTDVLLFLFNALIAFAFGFLLYLARLWSAGDSKLFLAFAMLFPPGLYPSNFVFFPAFSIVLNSFVPAFLALTVLSLLRTTPAEKLDALKSTLEPSALVSLALILFAFYWVLLYFFSFIVLPLDFFLIVLLLFLFVSALERIFPKKMALVSAVLTAIFAFLNVSELAQPAFWIVFALIFVLMLFMRFFVLYLGFFAFGRRTEINELRPGMVLLEGVYEKNGFLEKKKLFFPSLINAFEDIKTNYLFDLGAKGLTAENIAFLGKKSREGKAKFHSLLIQETLPFAPLLFAGALLTFFCSLFLPWC
jgi:Flp pilus assembly protein protease CpaA